MAFSATYQVYSGSLVTTDLLSGSNTNLVLSAFGGSQSVDVREQTTDNLLEIGETIEFSDGVTATVLGSGTVTPGVSVLGLTVPLGTPSDVVVAQDNDTGDTIFLYPDGEPNILGSVALVANVDETAYNVPPSSIICFAAGTMILTNEGETPVEQLTTQSKLITMDEGYLKPSWIGSTTVSGRGRFAPIRIKAGRLDNTRDLFVSPNHRLLIKSSMAALLFEESEVMVAAKFLTALAGVDTVPRETITYYHIMFEGHQLIYSEGIPTESLHPGDVAMGALWEEAKQEVLDLFPELAQCEQGHPLPDRRQTARKVLKRYEAEVLTLSFT